MLSKINNQLIIELYVNMKYLTIVIKSLTIVIKVRGTFANNQCEVSGKLFLLGLAKCSQPEKSNQTTILLEW